METLIVLFGSIVIFVGWIVACVWIMLLTIFESKPAVAVETVKYRKKLGN